MIFYKILKKIINKINKFQKNILKSFKKVLKSYNINKKYLILTKVLIQKIHLNKIYNKTKVQY